jgi:hypothetical protein
VSPRTCKGSYARVLNQVNEPDFVNMFLTSNINWSPVSSKPYIAKKQFEASLVLGPEDPDYIPVYCIPPMNPYHQAEDVSASISSPPYSIQIDLGLILAQERRSRVIFP